MKVAIYTEETSRRLQYIAGFIFHDLMSVDIVYFNNIEAFKSYDGVKINYSRQPGCEKEFHLSPVDLLFQKNITPQPIRCFDLTSYKAFFETPGADFSFDFFAASFYLLSRYEEYLPYQKDMYGRFAHENSIAFKNGFLSTPLINLWVIDFVKSIQQKFSSFNIAYKVFSFIPTYDIDIAFSYQHKGLLRNVGGFVKSPSLERIAAIAGAQKDPFDTYDWLDELHKKYHLSPVYFFLLAEKNGMYDKNILPSTKAMEELVKSHAEKYQVGIHPSWQSGDDDALLIKEMEQLKTITGKPVLQSRQHYIRFNLPEGYRRLLQEGITDDYSMGYGSINGFRASVASSFYWYDLKKDKPTTLRIHPFCFMEANSYYEEKLTAEEAFDELMQYYQACKKVNGTLITIWHNHMVGSDKLYEGWGAMYEKFITAIA